MKVNFYAKPYRDFKTKKWIMAFESDEQPVCYDRLKDKDVRLELKEYKEKRSSRANRYAWELIGKIADILRNSKDDVYLTMLKRYGQSEVVSVQSNINITGYFKYYEEIGKGHVDGKEFTHYKIFKGSSEYDTREMAILIDGIVSEAKEMGIETMTPDELKRMVEQWKVS